MNSISEMLAFGELGKAQIVEVPDVELAGDSLCQLETIFQCMQAAPGRTPISVGDVIHLGGNRYLVAGVGFRQLPEAEYLHYLAMPMVERLAYAATANLPRRQRF